MSAADDALAVARFCFPEHEWRAGRKAGDVITFVRRAETYWCSYVHEHIAAAERVLVERGLAEEYSFALLGELDILKDFEAGYVMPKHIVAIRTAPLEVCLRALARVVREQQPKETEA